MTDIERIAELAEGLTEAQKQAVSYLTTEWSAGPDLPADISSEMRELLYTGLVEREFADKCRPTYAVGDGTIGVSLSACWWFRLTPVGLAVRAHLRSPQ